MNFNRGLRGWRRWGPDVGGGDGSRKAEDGGRKAEDGGRFCCPERIRSFVEFVQQS